MRKKYNTKTEFGNRAREKLKEKAINNISYNVAERMNLYMIENNIPNDFAFSKLCDIPKSSMSGYLNGLSEIKLEPLIKIAEKMKVTTDYLLGLSNIKSTNLVVTNINSEIGLSELAINNLKNIKEIDPKLLKTVNIILETEYCNEEEMLLNHEIDNHRMFMEENKDYEKSAEQKIEACENLLIPYENVRRKIKPVYLISEIHKFLNISVDKEEKIYVDKNKLLMENDIKGEANKSIAKLLMNNFDLNNKLINKVYLESIDKKLTDLKGHLYESGGDK